MTREDREFSIVVFGATGDAGRAVCRYLATKQGARPVKWAVAGRSKAKLEALVSSLGGSSAPSVLLADACDASSLLRIAERATLVFSAVGPYSRLGEPMVKACLVARTHWADITGEVFWVGEMEAKHEAFVAAKMSAYKRERYGGWLGGLTWAKDKLLGMPGAVDAFYEAGRELYLQRMDGVISRVADIVGGDLGAAKQRIARGRSEISAYVTSLPQDLRKVGTEAATEMGDRFEQLESDVDAKQDERARKARRGQSDLTRLREFYPREVGPSKRGTSQFSRTRLKQF